MRFPPAAERDVKSNCKIISKTMFHLKAFVFLIIREHKKFTTSEGEANLGKLCPTFVSTFERNFFEPTFVTFSTYGT